MRGFTLQRERASDRYRIVDDAGVATTPGTVVSEPLPLDEALRQALAATRKHVRGPMNPAFGSAPFELLGYERPRLFRPGCEVSEDGRAGATFRWNRRRDRRGLIDPRPERPGAPHGGERILLAGGGRRQPPRLPTNAGMVVVPTS